MTAPATAVRGRMRRATAVLVAGMLAVGALVAADPAEPTCAVEEVGEPGWGSNRPAPPARDTRSVQATGVTSTGDYTGFSVGQDQGLYAAVVDANSLQVTGDAGCTWELAYSFARNPDATEPIVSASARFVDVAVSDRNEGVERIVALVYDLDAGVSARVRTIISDDGGKTFEIGGVGLPDALLFPPSSLDGCGPGLGCMVKIAPSDPDRVYVSLSGSSTTFHVSTDGGSTFRTVGSVLGGEGGNGAPIDFDIHRDNADVLWGVESNRGVISSTDGGASWREHDLGDAVGNFASRGLAVAVIPGAELDEVAAIVISAQGTEHVVHTNDGGLTWRAEGTLFGQGLIALASGSGPGQFLVTSSELGAVTLVTASLDFVPIGGSSLGPLRDIHQLTDSSIVWFRGPFTLPVTGDIQFAPPLEVPNFDFDLPAFDPLNPLGRLPGTLAVPPGIIALEVGESTTAEVTLDLPRSPTPLDVFFLFDQSGSMQAEMEALARGMQTIANELTRRRIDLNVGLGGYSGGWRYQLHRDIGAPDAEFQSKLQSMRAGGGSGIEPAYTALHQIATGTGLPSTAAGTGPPKGWNAHWRNGAIRVVVNLTDERLQVERFPSVTEATQALIDQEIRHIGLISGDRVDFDSDADNPTSLDSGVNESDSPFGPVAVLSRRTGALAPSAGADCSRDGEIDIQPGFPLACYLSPLATLGPEDDSIEIIPNLADVVIDILESVTQEETIEFYAQAPDVITSITALVNPTVDIRQPQTIPARLAITCPLAQSGKILRPLVSAVASSRFLAANNVVIACGPVDFGPLLAPAALAAAAAPAQAPPPPPVPVPVAASVQVSAQAASGANAAQISSANAMVPQVGMAGAVQQDQSMQVASIAKSAADSGDSPGLALEYSTRREQPDQAPVTLMLGAAMTMGVGVLARRRRTAGAAARVRVGR
ncbi:MAG: hypothetical protein ACI867_001498 [Glaciecola sp.]|jgi:hypothetical protein